MDERLFQEIFSELKKVLPLEWSRIAFFAGYTKGSYTMKYYIDDGKTGYIDCFKLGNVNKSSLVRLFMNIDKIISPNRNSLDESKKWTVLSLFVNSEGKISAKFDYTDISENAIAYEQEWKERWLK